jgi:hypothetical protein
MARRGRGDEDDTFRDEPSVASLNDVARSQAAAHITEGDLTRAAILDVDVAPLARANHHGTLQLRHQLTRAKANAVLKAIQDWQVPEQACRSNGITKELLAKYRRLADDPEAHPIYGVFIESYDQIIGERQAMIVRQGNDVASVAKDTGWNKFLLAAYSPEFRQKVQVEVEGRVSMMMEEFLEACRAELPSEVYQRVLEIAVSQGSRGAPRLPRGGT